MRKTIDPQLKIGEISVPHIEIDLKSRDDIPKILLGLQYIFSNVKLRNEVFEILDSSLIKGDKNNGRPGMDLWTILVLGTLRLGINSNYDRIHELANNHLTLREMLGHGYFDKKYYNLQTIKDNVKLFTVEILDKINAVVVKSGHELLKKKVISARVDSFVVESNVHYPTDFGLLFDAIRKIITLMMRLCFNFGISSFIQGESYIKKIKTAYREIQRVKKFKSKNKEELIKKAFTNFLEIIEKVYLKKTNETLSYISSFNCNESQLKKINEVISLLSVAEKLIDQIKRRILNGEKIPHNEKIFSIFEEYTEWICKGKAGVSQELGLNVVIAEDESGFILNHQIMQKERDASIAVEFMTTTKELFPSISCCSFDKGFYSSDNKNELKKLIDEVILPKKGKCNKEEKLEEKSPRFKMKKRKHSGVESAINSLEHHGLDRCPDRKLSGFSKYVSFAVLSFNLHKLGAIIQKRKLKNKKISDSMKLYHKLRKVA